ncbi:HNH endonuclease [Haloferax sp. DFSO60]|uniref:HNH endonuclease n=1 Tax=Haloferax sp. DFSO60 TaxID=3388652 RepID=UPI00397E4540
MYCDECYSESGVANGNWKGAKETAQCTVCGSSFEYYPSNKKGIYCSTCVDEANGLLPENPAVRLERVVTSCSHCEAEIQRLESQIQSNEYGVFCDSDCYGEWLSVNVVGEQHHQWEGGSFNYGERWWRVRRLALKRDEYSCQRCGADRNETGQNPDVHHLMRVRDFEHPSDAHTLDNVISLCRTCHRLVESGNARLRRKK